MKKLFALTLASVMTLSLFACGGSNGTTYTASSVGFGGDVTVEVTINEGEILSVEVVDHSETAVISDDAINELPNTIVATQSVGIDVVSGATYSSYAIFLATIDCLEQAGLDPNDYK